MGKKVGHDCSSKVKHEEYGVGDCIKEMHTLDENGNITHYDVLFSDRLVKNVSVENLEVLVREYHEHYINCLLYTSPSPRDRTRSRMPSSA